MAQLNENMFVSPVHSLFLTSVHLSIHMKIVQNKKGGKKQYFALSNIKINILIFFFLLFCTVTLF